jgi:hypothetical protein
MKEECGVFARSGPDRVRQLVNCGFELVRIAGAERTDGACGVNEHIGGDAAYPE